MKLTIDLPDSVANILWIRAERYRTDLPGVVTRLIQERLEADAAAIDPLTLAALREGIADGEAGREQPFEEYRAEMQAQRAARQAAHLANEPVN